MNTKKVSPEEVAALCANPHKKVSEKQISFMLAFKEAFLRLRVEGYTVNTAFQKLGYGLEVLGFERVHNITKRIRQAARRQQVYKA